MFYWTLFYTKIDVLSINAFAENRKLIKLKKKLSFFLTKFLKFLYIIICYLWKGKLIYPFISQNWWIGYMITDSSNKNKRNNSKYYYSIFLLYFVDLHKILIYLISVYCVYLISRFYFSAKFIFIWIDWFWLRNQILIMRRAIKILCCIPNQNKTSSLPKYKLSDLD